MSTPAPPRRGTIPGVHGTAADDRALAAAAQLLALLDQVLTEQPGRARARHLLDALAAAAADCHAAMRRATWTWAELRHEAAARYAHSGETLTIASPVIRAAGRNPR